MRLRAGSPAATRAVGAAIAGVLRPGDVVLLSGELGAGKTTLVKGIVEALGGGDCVTSPTFTLCHLYPTSPPVAHVDAWRMEQLGEALDLALEEALDEGAVAVVEWGEALAPLYGRGALTVLMRPGESAECREIELRDDGSAGSWSGRLARLAAAVEPGIGGVGLAGAEGGVKP
ncbi:MAG TPA: tRNA (adenosine(37)-N6)-threonylcarbamoyltransferase complex ATPase subunit type 1 TsaE [Acidimicrobiales bacterium]|nr:tRNA (adenosine(37)-N6)-threonylcarbamoyltransferase complex ATPase subunit type 1 TsaE [Acidimicrobiales bacterium]